MTGTIFKNYIRYLTKTTANTLTDADLLMLAGVEQAAIAESIASNVDEGYFLMEDVRNLEAGVRKYTYPQDLLKSLKYIAAKLDGIKWSYLREIDFGYIEGRNLPLMEETTIQNEFANKTAKFMFTGTEIMLLNGAAIPVVAGGLKIVAEVYPENLVAADLAGTSLLSVPSVSTAVRLPLAAYKPLAKMVSIAYKTSKDKPLPLTEDEKLLPVDLSNLYTKLRGRNAVRVIQGSVPYDDGQNY